MSAFAAMLLNAYRELNSRRMFWITLILSALAESVLLLVGFSDDGLHFRVAWWDTPFPVPPGMELADVLKGIFVTFGIGVWLTWAASILALISTASIIPDFVSSGSIDLVLARPIGRVRLFLMKYVCGLLFVGLQVAAFSLAAFVILGWRTGQWLPGLLLAIPLVVAFFSYLYCVCALAGLITRSTIASLLMTLLFWLALFAANFIDGLLLMPRVMGEIYVEKLGQRMAEVQQADPPDESRMTALHRELDEATQDLAGWRKWHRLVVTVKTALPKTAETIKLLERSLVDMADLPDVRADEADHQAMPFLSPRMRAAGVRIPDIARRVESNYRNRSVSWVLGTSLAFELAVLALACVIFSRRDY